MVEERVQRRLAAILAADVVGYSRLVEADEAGTVARVKGLLNELIQPTIANDGGRVVKIMGDGVLVEYGSAVDAVRNALAIQAEIDRRNTDVAQADRIELRVGINLGDVIIDGEDIQGDGVNIAARLEGLCKPREVYVSGTVRDHVDGKLAAVFDDLGEQTVKNIARPLRVYRVRHEVTEGARQIGASTALPLPDKPSIAVLPFANMSGDPDQEYFADGMAEDITTALSRFHWFFVIARNSSFTYKGSAVDVRQVGRELGVRYVLEGSVRKGGSRLRITAQLVEAETGNHIWADKYDGALEDVFDLQDQITAGVAGAIEPSLRQAEIDRARRKRPDSLDAYDHYLRALPHAWAFRLEDAEKGLVHLDRALDIDPGYGPAHALAAICHLQRFLIGGFDLATAVVHARAALDSGTDDAGALSGAALALSRNEPRDGLAAIERALAINPNSATALGRSAIIHMRVGRFNTAIEHAERAILLNPLDPLRYNAENALSNAHWCEGRYEAAAAAANRALEANRWVWQARLMLVASYQRLGRKSEAAEAARQLVELHPRVRIADFHRLHMLPTDHLADLVAACRAAGLTE